ncbi:MAG: hypothetical protein ACYST5_16070 [Planctomycetota bacterium]
MIAQAGFGKIDLIIGLSIRVAYGASISYSSRQDNTISRTPQVHVSAFTTRRTEFFGWTGS